MGLDMYLTARVSTYRSYGEQSDADRAALETAAKAIGLPESDNIDGISLEREVGYWRKANQVHAWFVKHVQDGEDECKEHYVSREQLAALRDVCNKVIADVSLAEQLLPTQSGFFFGGTEYDEWYLEDLKRTVAIVEKCLALPKTASFYYQSSW